MQAAKRPTTRILYIAGSEKRLKKGLKNRARSMSETQAKSLKVCFRGIHIPFTESGAILMALIRRPEVGRERQCRNGF